ncbi:MAG: hypothetical protein F4Z08_11420 [Chloroflexi bacterium]|nr:hypothetical protein [Chloroflexota bacterium]
MTTPRAAGPLHRAARRWLPRRLRSEVAIARRHLRDRRRRDVFATRHGEPSDFPHAFEGYALPMIIYPGQEHVAEGKLHNQRLMATALDGVRIGPGEVLSLWRCAGRPSARRGYLPGAAIVAGELVTEDGGATCLLSTVLYNAGLLAGLDVLERHNHSVDQYGAARYFEPGRDATIEYGVLDLRFRNPHPFAVLLELTSDDERVAATFRAPVADLPAVEVAVELPPAGAHAWSARTRRTVTPPGGAPRREDLGWSVYRVPDARYLRSAARA